MSGKCDKMLKNTGGKPRPSGQRSASGFGKVMRFAQYIRKTEKSVSEKRKIVYIEQKRELILYNMHNIFVKKAIETCLNSMNL